MDSTEPGVTETGLNVDIAEKSIPKITLTEMSSESMETGLVTESKVTDLNKINVQSSHKNESDNDELIVEDNKDDITKECPDNVYSESDNLDKCLDSNNIKVEDESIKYNQCESQQTEVVLDYGMMEYRNLSSDDDSSSSVSSDDESGPGIIDSGSSDDSDHEKSAKHSTEKEKGKKTNVIRTKGELCLEDLPPIEDLQITVDESVHLFDVGSVSSVVGVLVIVQGKPDMPALNTDSILFIEGRKSLGQVFETFGPVASPLYAIRFNNPEEIEEKCIEKGMSVYYAPDKEEYTHYVFVNQMTRMKGSDASWEHNNEPPVKFLDYSDDEQERNAKKKKKKHGHEDNDQEEGNKENNEKRARNRKRWEKKQRMGNVDDQGNQSQGYQQRQGGSNRNNQRREGSFQSWPPSRSEMAGNEFQNFRPPPPPQIIPEGYIPSYGSSGFQMRQPRPFHPPPHNRFMHNPPSQPMNSMHNGPPGQAMNRPPSGPSPPPMNGPPQMPQLPTMHGGPSANFINGSSNGPPIMNGPSNADPSNGPPPYSNMNYNDQGNYPHTPHMQQNGPFDGPPPPYGGYDYNNQSHSQRQDSQSSFDNGSSHQHTPQESPTQNMGPPPGNYFSHHMRGPPHSHQFNCGGLPYPAINSPPPPYPPAPSPVSHPLSHVPYPPRGHGAPPTSFHSQPAPHRFGGPPRFSAGPRSNQYRQNGGIMDSRLMKQK